MKCSQQEQVILTTRAGRPIGEDKNQTSNAPSSIRRLSSWSPDRRQLTFHLCRRRKRRFVVSWLWALAKSSPQASHHRRNLTARQSPRFCHFEDDRASRRWKPQRRFHCCTHQQTVLSTLWGVRWTRFRWYSRQWPLPQWKLHFLKLQASRSRRSSSFRRARISSRRTTEKSRI